MLSSPVFLLFLGASLVLACDDEPHASHRSRHRRLAKKSTTGFVQLSGISFGVVPDEGDAGGPKTSLAQLNKAIGGKLATYGYYAQAHAGTTFDGSQLLAVMDDVVASGAIFEAAVMPVGGFQGYSNGGSQATAICNVMNKFVAAGVTTRLRFAHECKCVQLRRLGSPYSYYVKDGTYTGSQADCKAAFTGVAQTCRKIAPKVQMFLTPNVDGNGLSAYQAIFPDDGSLVDVCGIDYYPQSADDMSFLDAHKQFYDFCQSKNSKIVYGIAETGLGYAGSDSARLNWLKQAYSSATRKAMPKLKTITWFKCVAVLNLSDLFSYQKGYDFRVITTSSSSSTTKNFLKLSGLSK